MEFSVYQYSCMVISSKETKRTKEAISTTYDDYAFTSDLVTTVTSLGFAKDDKKFSKPGLTAIFEFELSEQATEFRLKPTWVRLSHSIREKRTDKHARDLTIEFSIAIPGADKPITSLIKFEGAKIGQPIHTEGIATQWMPVPAINSSELNKQKSLSESSSKKTTYTNAALLAGAAANALGADTWIPPGESTKWNPILPDNACPSIEGALEEWRYAHALHAEESAKSKNDINAKTLSMLSNAVSYFENCSKAQESAAKVVKLTPSNGKLARSYDFSVTIKEFRKRPVAQFFGDALSDGDTRSSLASTLLGEIDPYTKAKAKEEETKVQLAALGVYEQARHDAELAIIEYQNASATDKASKLLNMDFKKRAANRAADRAGVTQPYPDKGTWIQ